jgi:prepilin-type N-terminal cleavage/methylation domain-containing protein
LDLGSWVLEVGPHPQDPSSNIYDLTSTTRYIHHPRPKIEDRSSQFGFTLLELLISMTILALIFVTVLGAISVGSKSWESGELRAEENQRTRTLFDTLARELSMIYPLRVKDQDRDVIAFTGTPDSLSFATMPRSYGSEPFSHMIRIVKYTVVPDRGLVATEHYPSLGGSEGSDSLGARDKPLDGRVSEAHFRYLVPEGRPEEKLPPKWQDAWDPSEDTSGTSMLPSPGFFAARVGQRPLRGSDRLPLAVEITMTIRQRSGPEATRETVLPPLVFPVQVGRSL